MVAFIELKHEIQSIQKVVTRLYAKFHFKIPISAQFAKKKFRDIFDLKPKMLCKIGYNENSNMKFCKNPGTTF